ncbi:hypothetical protein ACK8P5_16400 [Paenibacillus sp. EC2-1]|uniref:hypothetical protein n=1 Tax=Paenibacillus sp. EC2-1 TaxID=3388665 RepID=UPI003BEECFF4
MRYIDWLKASIGSEVEVSVVGDVIIGELSEVDNAFLSVKIPPIIYGPPTETSMIPLQSVQFVRIVSL